MKILMVLTSHDQLGNTGRKTGFWLEEFAVLRRHDCSVNVAGGFRASQLISDYVEASGIYLPAKRRAYTRGPDHRPILEMLMVSIDISEVLFE